MSSTVINTNVMSLNAQNNLRKSENALSVSMARLSSGLRINSARDDAAGLAISDRFTSQIRGNDQSVRNANDGISLSQVAEGALSTISTDLQRMRELAVQSANDTNSALDRLALDNEFQQLIRAIGRVSNTTEFNTRRLLDGTLQTQVFQTGANQGQTIAIAGVDARNTQLGGTQIVGGPRDANGTIDFAMPLGLTEAQMRQGGLEINGSMTINIGTVRGITINPALSLDINMAGEFNPDATPPATNITTLDDLVRVINSAIEKSVAGTEPDGTFTPADDADARLRLAQANISAAVVTRDDGTSTVIIRGAFGTEFELVNGDVKANFESGNPSPIDIFAAAATTSEKVNITEVDITTRERATMALHVLDGALSQISDLRSELGAIQKRFESTVDNLGIYNVNLSASRSRIMDADFAAETAALTRGQILQQAGISTLAQANASPQAVLALLQG